MVYIPCVDISYILLIQCTSNFLPRVTCNFLHFEYKYIPQHFSYILCLQAYYATQTSPVKQTVDQLDKKSGLKEHVHWCYFSVVRNSIWYMMVHDPYKLNKSTVDSPLITINYLRINSPHRAQSISNPSKDLNARIRRVKHRSVGTNEGQIDITALSSEAGCRGTYKKQPACWIAFRYVPL